MRTSESNIFTRPDELEQEYRSVRSEVKVSTGNAGKNIRIRPEAVMLWINFGDAWVRHSTGIGNAREVVQSYYDTRASHDCRFKLIITF